METMYNTCPHSCLQEFFRDRKRVPVKHIHLYLQEFEDLDEIIARHVQPMAASVRDIIGHRYYKETDDKREVIEKLLADDKKKTPSK